MGFMRSVEWFSGEHIRYLLPLKITVLVFQLLTDSSTALAEAVLQIPHFFPMSGNHMVNNLHESLKKQHNLQTEGQGRHHKNTYWESSEDKYCNITMSFLMKNLILKTFIVFYHCFSCDIDLQCSVCNSCMQK